MFLYLNSRFEEGFNLQNQSCIDTAFVCLFVCLKISFIMKSHRTYQRVKFTASQSTELLLKKSLQGMVWKVNGRNCKTTYAFQNKTYSEHSTSVHTYLKENEQSMMLKRTSHALESQNVLEHFIKWVRKAKLTLTQSSTLNSSFIKLPPTYVRHLFYRIVILFLLQAR